MADNRLQVNSATGDETIGRYKWVVHGASNATEALSILDAGISFVPGRATFSTNLVHAYDWTTNREKQAQSLGAGAVQGQPGRVILCAVPPHVYLGHGTFTSAYIDRSLKRVGGNPLKYASARKQLALYTGPDTEAERVRIETEVAGGLSLSERPRQAVPPQFVLGSFGPDPSLDNLLTQLDVAVRDLQDINFGSFSSALAGIIRPQAGVSSDVILASVNQMLEGTVESIIMARLRMMRWQGLALRGYSFYEGKQEARISVPGSVGEHLARVDEFGRKLESSPLFVGNLAWLKAHVRGGSNL